MFSQTIKILICIIVTMCLGWKPVLPANASETPDEIDCMHLYQQFATDIWEYYQMLPKTTRPQYQRYLIDLIENTLYMLSEINIKTEYTFADLFRDEARSHLYVSLGYKIVDNPTKAEHYVTKALKYDGVLEGYDTPDFTKQLKPEYEKLREWLATFGFAEIEFIDFPPYYDWSDFEISLLAEGKFRDDPMLMKYRRIAEREISYNVEAAKFDMKVALKNGNYLIRTNREEVPDVYFAIDATEETQVTIKPHFWFKLMIIDPGTGKEYAGKHIKIFNRSGDRLTDVNLSRMPFGFYNFYGKGNLVVPDSLNNIQFEVLGATQGTSVDIGGTVIMSLDHGDAYQLEVTYIERRGFIRRLLGAIF